MDLELLRQTLADHGEPAYRAKQVWAWTARNWKINERSNPQ